MIKGLNELARIPLPYKTENNITELLIMEQARRATEARGTSRPSLRELEGELSKYCSVTQDTINLMRRNKHQPSLPVAIKVCEFLGKRVDEVFKLVVNSEVDEITPTQLKKIEMIEEDTGVEFTGKTFDEAKEFILKNEIKLVK